MQTTLVILIVAACIAWLAVMAYRFLRLKPGSKACAGGCCDAAAKPATQSASTPTQKTQMISSDDLRTRLAARQK